MRLRASQTSESLELALVLALSGGLMDAYSYLGRGKVFANAQTGNLLLLGVNLAGGDFGAVARYAFPVLSFALGCVLSTEMRLHLFQRMHWRQYVLLVQVVLLLAVSCLDGDANLLANSLTSLACGMQVQAFRKLHGRAFATTMCIGNLRAGTQALVVFAHEHERRQLRTALLYYGVIVAFVLGAVLGMWLLGAFGLLAIRGCCVLLALALLLMFHDREASSPMVG